MIETEKKTHFHLLNIIKLLSMIAITILHTNEFIFFEDFFPLEQRTNIYPLILKFARLIPFSGHTIVSIVFFLWGLKQTPFARLRKVLPILLIGQFLITISFLEGKTFFEAWEWDIYCFLFVSILCLRIVQNFSRRSHFILLILSAALFVLTPLIPIGWFGNNLISEIVIGGCPWGKTGSWPLLPWLGLPLLSYSAGVLIKDRASHLSFLESLLWAMALIWTPLTWGNLYQTPIGPQFYCFMFNQPFLIFWGHFLIILFLMRISLLASLQSKLDQFRFIKWLSYLHWSRHLGVCYLTQIFILCLLSDAGPYFLQHPFIFDLFFLSLLPLIEIFVLFIFKIQKAFILWQKN